MKAVLRRELWRMLLGLCLLTAAAAYFWFRKTGEALPVWVPAVLAVWCLLLGLSRRLGAWAPAALCLLALSLALLSLARSGPEGLADLSELPAFLPALLSLASLIFWYAPDSFALRAGAALVWLGLWLSAALQGWELPRLTVAAMLPLPLLAVCEAHFLRSRRGETEQFALLRGGLSLVLALASLLTLFVPAPAEPYDYPVLRAVVEKAEELWHDVETQLAHRREGNAQFGLPFGGLAEQPETGTVGGTEGGSAALLVQPYTATGGPLYLIGNTWDRFDGRSWSQAEPEEDARGLLWNADTLEHVYALWRWQNAHGGTDDARFFRTNHIYLLYREMETRTMFSAMDALHFYFDEDRFPYTPGANGLLFDYQQQRGTAYRMYWLESNARTADQLIAFSEGYRYDPAERRIWYSLKERYERRFHLDMRDGTVLEELLRARQERIYARDLGTEGVSERAAALAATITADCDTDYEKLRAIAAYLQSNFRYTLSPTPVPEGENFLDWLLFETREGYCTWYATAAVLLARSVGVPARYVQGYRCGALPTRRYTSLGPEAAHAWCEGYVAGYGWVTVEATPGFSARGTGWVPPGEEARAALPEEELDFLPEKGHGHPLSDEAESTVQLPATAEDKTGDEAEASPGPQLWYLALLPPGLALGYVLFRLLRRRKLRRRYLEAPPEEQVRQDLGRLLDYLRRRGYPRAPEESIHACFAALPWFFLPSGREQALEMAEFYERVLFGGHVPSPEEVAAQRVFVDSFRPARRWGFR